MDSLHAEQCEPQMKIDIFVNAIRNTFFQQNEKATKQMQTTEQHMMTLDASTTMDFEPKSTKQTQTIEQPKMAQNPSNNTKKTASSETDDTDSAYNTDTEHLPRPPRNKNLPKPSASTRPNTQTTAKRLTVPAPKTSTASTYQQHKRKTPLLPTPPASARQFYNSNHYKQHFAGPSAVNNRNSTFSRPSTVISRPPPRNNYRFHQTSYIPRPHTPEFNTQQPPLLPRPPYQRQNIMTGPYQQHQQTQGHFFTRPYQQQQPHGHFPQPVYNIHISLPYYTT